MADERLVPNAAPGECVCCDVPVPKGAGAECSKCGELVCRRHVSADGVCVPCVDAGDDLDDESDDDESDDDGDDYEGWE